MTENPPIILLSDSTVGSAQRDTIANVTQLELDILGEKVCFGIGIVERQARLQDIVPLARMVSAKIIETVRANLRQRGIAVPCRKGCVTCCYFPVSLSIPEAFRLMEEVEAMPSELHADVMQRCWQLAVRLRQYLRERGFVNKYSDGDTLIPWQMEAISDWYAAQEWPCPFLHNNVCVTYDQRPIVCRETLKAGTVSPCRIDKKNEGWNVRMPVSIANALRILQVELEHTHQQVVVLPCIFDWYQDNAEGGKRSWPAFFLVEQFIKILQRIQKPQDYGKKAVRTQAKDHFKTPTNNQKEAANGNNV